MREGFKGFLEPRQHGSVFLLLDTDPSLVDVNVHPTKSEVRFRREREIFALIKNSLQEALNNDPGSFPVLGGDTASNGHLRHNRTVIKPAVPTIIEQERFCRSACPAAMQQLDQSALRLLLT